MAKKPCGKEKHPLARLDDKIIDMRNVEKTYHLGKTRVDALRGVDVAVGKGDSVALMGPSGSGKSTLLHIMGCLDVPSKGQYFLDKVNVNTLTRDELAKTRAKKIGFVFQFFHLIPSLNAVENVMLPMMFDSIGEEERWKKAEGLMAKVGLSGRTHHRPNELSGGERQRVAIARALSQDPSILLADEPTGNLDSKVGAEIIKLFCKLHDDEGITLVTVTHDISIARHAHRIIHLQDGKIVGQEEVV